MRKLFTIFAAVLMSTSLWALNQEGGYYLIGSAQDLKDFAALVNDGNTTANGKLTANIDLQGSLSNQWTPIGNSTYPYNGTFDGQGYTISNLYYHQVVSSAGLFCHAGSSARIKNVRVVVDIDNTGHGATAANGSTEAGGILGTGVEGTLIINCSVAGSVISFSNVGGIAGLGSVTIVNCYNEATVKFYNNNGQVGSGIHGYWGSPTIINCYNVGKVINTAPSATSHMGNIAVSGTATNCYSLENSCQNGASAAWSNKASNGIPGTTMTADAMQNISFTNLLYANALDLRSTYPDIDTWMQDPTTGRPILKQSFKPTEGPWTRAGEITGCCQINYNDAPLNPSIAWKFLNNTQWSGTIFPYKDNTNGLGSQIQATTTGYSKQAIYTLYTATQTVPSYSTMVWNWSFRLSGQYTNLAQQIGLYAGTDLNTLKATALDFTYNNETQAGSDICVGLYSHNGGHPGPSFSQDSNHDIRLDNRNGSTDLQQSVYMIQTHIIWCNEVANTFGTQWMAFKHLNSSYTYYYYKIVTFNANGGSGGMPQQQIENSGALSANTLTRDGYVFAGWNTNADGTGLAYTDQDILTATAADKGPVTLYAQWVPVTYRSALKTGTEDAANWSVPAEWTTMGTAVNVAYSGENKVLTVAAVPTSTSWLYSYTGNIQSFTAPCAGTYELRVWGAQGGKMIAAGGLGGYATCRTTLAQGETIYIYVGGKGGDGVSQAGGEGGWNGGGHGGGAVSGFNGSAGGGGATHISKVNNQVIGSGSGQCTSLVGTNFIIVAGGGGGGGAHGYTSAGNGGGENGGLGTRHDGSAYDHAVQVNYTSQYYYSTGRSYGANGGNGYGESWACEGAGGGGGGYYGGNANVANSTFTTSCQDAGGCGGNSAYNSSLASNFTTTAGVRTSNGQAQIVFLGTAETIPVTKTSTNHYRYAMPNSDIEVRVTYVTEYATLTAPTTKSLTYNGSEQELINAGSTNDGTLQYSLDETNWSANIPIATNAGNYTVYYRVVADDNHLDNPGSSVAVTISPAPLSITADNKQVVYLQAAPTYTATYTGFVNSETESVLTGTLAYTCTYAPGNALGDYAITPSGLSSDNYAITFYDGTLQVVSPAAIVLPDNEDKTSLLTALNNQTLNVTIGRTIYAGPYNTFCLPFSMSAEQIAASPLNGAILKDYNGADVTGTGAERDLNIHLTDLTQIEAGKPFLVKTETNIVDPTFNGVTITYTGDANGLGQNIVADYVDFQGLLAPFDLAGTYQSSPDYLGVGMDGRLYWADATLSTAKMRAFRAFFHVKATSIPNSPVRRGMHAQFVEDAPQTPTGVEPVTGNPSPVTEKILRNGQVIIIRNGVEYTVTGQKLK
ncbi:MAG: InlB B-repeat-containing protein [Paludibacteraceae bacterium]|nr:InlB B-repeat-containing protein [Paludibacteraceae bacterium]